MNCVTLVSIAVIFAGSLLLAYDELYGPKDDIIYLWPIPVVLLMVTAICVLIYQVGALISRRVQ